MLGIMQSYGEIVVCVGSSASNANAEIFLQSDCSIAIEPLYPQVCQDMPAYTEANLLNNRLSLPKPETTPSKWRTAEVSSIASLIKPFVTLLPLSQPSLLSPTISPIYISRMLNAIPCSIATCRDDPISFLSLFELSRRFSNGLWSCIQFWACCGCSLALMNTTCACLALPPILTPFSLLYLMCIAVPILSTTLVRIEPDSDIMNRATAKKHSAFESRVFVFVICCYGFKFLPTVLITVLSYCFIMSHPILALESDPAEFYNDLDAARVFALFVVVCHFGECLVGSISG